ncbi:DUF4328 domain-containing protein [Rhodococcus sp. 1168]|uniref:DUF4328 domain-containing protein n=1 Tax=Rhodococcus sp. 1168 TaxID=2018041 RepID=UPI000B5AFE7E|nr:DUF4328 domain-containing protein [Rhodococcus sp. 1168]
MQRLAAAPASATPQYEQIPRWGLIDNPAPKKTDDPSRRERWAESASGLLTLTMALLALACVAEVFRYGILLYNRTRLVNPRVLMASDALVVFAEVASIIIGASAAVAAVSWLVVRRGEYFARAGSRDPRSAKTMYLGSLVPALSLAMPGVYLTELVDIRGGIERAKLRTLVRVWWAVWVLDWALVLTVTLWRLRDSLQAEADGVLLSAVGALVAAAVAFTTVLLIRGIDSQGLRGTDRAAPTRWVISVDRSESGPNPSKTESAVNNEKVTAA